MSKQEEICEFFEAYDEKIEEFLDRYDNSHKNVGGNSFGFIGVLVAITSLIVAFLLYYTVDPTFSIFTHWISHLGAGPNGSNVIFNIGLVITSFFLFLFYMYHGREYRRSEGKRILVDILLITTTITSCGLFLVAIFPYNLVVLHSTAALIFFISGLCSSLLYAIFVLTTKGISKFQAVVGFTTAGIFTFHLASSIMGNLYAGIDSRLVYFTEWLALFAMVFMIFEISFYTERERHIFQKQVKERFIDYNHRLSISNIISLREFISSTRKE